MRSQNVTPPGKIKDKHGWPLQAFRLLAAGLLLLSSVAAFAQHGKIAADFGEFPVHGVGTVDVIIQFNQTPTDAHHQKVQNKGGVLKTKLDFIKGAHYSVPIGSVDALAEDPDVAYISPDRPLNGLLDNT